MKLVELCAAGLVVLAWTDAAMSAPGQPTYRATLMEGSPLEVRFELELPRGRKLETPIRLAPRSQMTLQAEPSCDKGTIEPVQADLWTAPRVCRKVRWTVSLVDQDRLGVDAAQPTGAWSARARTWLLTDRLPLLVVEGSEGSSLLSVDAMFAGGQLRIIAKPLPRPDQPPFYLAIAASDPPTVRGEALVLRQFGAAPTEATPERLQEVVRIWDSWRTHVVPADVESPSAIDLIWINAPPGTEPGFYASAGANGILMQSVPTGNSEKDRNWTEQAIILIGAHEGFHLLIAGLPQTWPEWTNESWASHFAWRAARGTLAGDSLKAAEQLVNAPASITLLEARGNRAAGIPPRTDILYGKGARFWAAIDAVLITRDGPAGRLGALIQDSHGFRGVDWESVDSLAAYLDERSEGRASAIIRCYLMTSGCPASP